MRKRSSLAVYSFSSLCTPALDGDRLVGTDRSGQHSSGMTGLCNYCVKCVLAV